MTPLFGTPPTEGYPRYVNGRFGFACTLPQDWEQAESDNGDGVTARSGEATVLCFGANNLERDSALAVHQQLKHDLLSDGWVVTLDRVTDKTSRLSGTRDGRILYRFTHVTSEVLHTVYWLYPESLKSELDQAVLRSVVEFSVR